jgi:hypothetical protein
MSGIRGPWTEDHPLPVVEIKGKSPPKVEHYFPPTVDNPLPVYIVHGNPDKPGQTPAGRAIIEDAPHDGRVYARCRGEWVPIGVQQE